MPFLQISNQIESAQARAFAAIAPAIIAICSIVTFFANLVILTIEAGESAAVDCRILLGKPTPVANEIVTVAVVQLTCRECIATLKARGLSRRSNGRTLNTAEMNELIAAQ